MTEPYPLAVTTMVYDDVDCLQIWLRHWRRHLDPAHLYVIIDGPNPVLEAMAADCRVIVRDRPEPHEAMEEERWVWLSAFTADLLTRYGVVVYTDVDEIIVADPKFRRPLVAALTAGDVPVRHPRGLELIHRRDLEPAALDLAAPILAQRQYFRTSGTYSKPCILRRPVAWGRGGHMSSYPHLHVARDLYTVHLRFFDIDLFLDRARRRRETTRQNEVLANRPNRQWRNSSEGAQAMMDRLAAMPVLPGRRILMQSVTWRMRRTWASAPNDKGLYSYYPHDSRVIQHLPRRFLSLF